MRGAVRFALYADTSPDVNAGTGIVTYEAAAPYLSLVVPAYNEALRLPRALTELAGFCKRLTFPCEVLIVVERSSDGTLEIATAEAAQQEFFRVIDNDVHRGKGFAVRTGVMRARGEIIFYMDADLSVPLSEIQSFVTYFEAHPETDVLVGNRQHGQSRITRQQAWLRRSMGQAFNSLLQSLSLVSLRDTQCGFKAFRRAAAQAIFARQTIDGFAFDVEVLLLAERLGYRIADLPVEWVNSPDSRVHIVRDSLRMIRDTLRVRRQIRRAFPPRT